MGSVNPTAGPGVELVQLGNNGGCAARVFAPALPWGAEPSTRCGAGAEPEVLDPVAEQVPRYLPALLFALATD